jgi:hypothetical protein
MATMKELDRECDAAIRHRFTEIIREIDNPRDLSDEDVLDAASYGERPYLDGTDMPATECADRAWERAVDMKVKVIFAQDVGNINTALLNIVK